MNSFSLYLYEKPDPNDSLFANLNEEYNGYVRRDTITDVGLARFQEAYPGKEINKKDLFYYIYGLLHSPDYHERFKNNLAKALPRREFRYWSQDRVFCFDVESDI